MQNKFPTIKRITGRWAWLVLVPQLVVCSGGGTSVTTAPPPVPVVTTVEVSPTTASLEVGATQSLTATVKDQSGNAMTGQSVAWSTSNAAAASVDLAGVVTGLAAGSAAITATSAGKSGKSDVTVAAPQPPVVTTVTVSPTSVSLQVGATTPLSATVKDQQGMVMTGQTVTWSTSNATVATVNSSGTVSGVAAGSATISATASGKTGTANITVTALPPVVTTVTVAPPTASIAVGATVALTATVKDAQGNVMTGQSVTWSTSNPSYATVNSSGLVTGVSAGPATITATSSGKSGTASITVTSPPPPPPVVTTVTVSPSTASIVVGATVALSATVKDALGNVMTGQSIVWSTSNAAAATVNSNGLVTGIAGGSATITATSAGKTGSSAVTITAAPPPPPPGGTLLFQENFEDANLASRGWYDNTGAVLSTTEHVPGSASSAQYRFTVGATSPTSGGSQRHKFTPSNSFYLSYYVKYSANWVGSNRTYHPHEFQVMSTLDGDYDGPSNGYMVLYVEQSYQNGGKPRVGMQDNKSVNYSYGALPNNLLAITESRSTGGCNGMAESNMAWECYDAGGYWYNLKQLLGPVVFQPNAGPGYKNDWNFVEAYFQLNTIVNGIGQADGVLQYWFNGTLIFDRHDILYRTGAHPTIQFNQFLIAPYIGDGSPVDQSMFIDNLRVATARIP
ncbi:MAG: hypothetical protein JWL97_1330 [Gemmatimonadales bacterium]|nr:hypothetical protein [Gemmatimonadales bacterium]